MHTRTHDPRPTLMLGFAPSDGIFVALERPRKYAGQFSEKLQCVGSGGDFPRNLPSRPGCDRAPICILTAPLRLRENTYLLEPRGSAGEFKDSPKESISADEQLVALLGRFFRRAVWRPFFRPAASFSSSEVVAASPANLSSCVKFLDIHQ